MGCLVRDERNPSQYREVHLENDFLSLTVLPDRGAEVSSFVNRRKGVDVLWKSPWGMRRQTTGDTKTLWMDGYAGGWQEIFPNGGDACVYKGAPLGFHGEASISQWDSRIEHSSIKAVSAEFSVRLARSPFALRRRMIVEEDSPAVRVEEELVNDGDEELEFMWGHHPAYGAPLLGGDSRLIVPAKKYLVHGNAETKTWPGIMSVPSPDQRVVAMGYLTGLREGWYELHNQRLGFGVRWNWEIEVFPYIWLWQELRGTFGYPWYGRCYVMGVEPFTSIPGSGLIKTIENGTARSLAPAACIQTTLQIRLTEGLAPSNRIPGGGSLL